MYPERLRIPNENVVSEDERPLFYIFVRGARLWKLLVLLLPPILG
jgi:hypothetical protein